MKNRPRYKKKAKEACNKRENGQKTDDILEMDDLEHICGAGKINKRECAGGGKVQQQADDEYEYVDKTVVAGCAGGHR